MAPKEHSHSAIVYVLTNKLCIQSKC